MSDDSEDNILTLFPEIINILETDPKNICFFYDGIMFFQLLNIPYTDNHYYINLNDNNFLTGYNYIDKTLFNYGEDLNFSIKSDRNEKSLKYFDTIENHNINNDGFIVVPAQFSDNEYEKLTCKGFFYNNNIDKEFNDLVDRYFSRYKKIDSNDTIKYFRTLCDNKELLDLYFNIKFKLHEDIYSFYSLSEKQEQYKKYDSSLLFDYLEKTIIDSGNNIGNIFKTNEDDIFKSCFYIFNNDNITIEYTILYDILCEKLFKSDKDYRSIINDNNDIEMFMYFIFGGYSIIKGMFNKNVCNLRLVNICCTLEIFKEYKISDDEYLYEITRLLNVPWYLENKFRIFILREIKPKLTNCIIISE